MYSSFPHQRMHSAAHLSVRGRWSGRSGRWGSGWRGPRRGPSSATPHPPGSVPPRGVAPGAPSPGWSAGHTHTHTHTPVRLSFHSVPMEVYTQTHTHAHTHIHKQTLFMYILHILRTYYGTYLIYRLLHKVNKDKLHDTERRVQG